MRLIERVNDNTGLREFYGLVEELLGFQDDQTESIQVAQALLLVTGTFVRLYDPNSFGLCYSFWGIEPQDESVGEKAWNIGIDEGLIVRADDAYMTNPDMKEYLERLRCLFTTSLPRR